MEKKFFLKAVIGAALFVSTVAGANAQDALARVKEAGLLKVGTETAYAPFDFIDAGTHAGLNVDLFDEIGKELGVKIEWVLLPWEGVLPGLEVGKFDIVGGPAGITKGRLARYRFTPPVAETTVALIKRKGDASIAKSEDIADKVVGGVKASAQLAELMAFNETLTNKAEVRAYPGYNEAIADLAGGRIIAVANVLPNLVFVAKQRPDTFEVVQPPFGTKSYSGYPGLKDEDHKSLMDAVDKAILKIKADGRLAKIQERWFGAAFETPDSVTDPTF